MVPGQGFEPRFTASKAAVLPLDDPGMLFLYYTFQTKNSEDFPSFCTYRRSISRVLYPPEADDDYLSNASGPLDI